MLSLLVCQRLGFAVRGRGGAGGAQVDHLVQRLQVVRDKVDSFEKFIGKKLSSRTLHFAPSACHTLEVDH